MKNGALLNVIQKRNKMHEIKDHDMLFGKIAGILPLYKIMANKSIVDFDRSDYMKI